jgi:hypothetical protein
MYSALYLFLWFYDCIVEKDTVEKVEKVEKDTFAGGWVVEDDSLVLERLESFERGCMARVRWLVPPLPLLVHTAYDLPAENWSKRF